MGCGAIVRRASFVHDGSIRRDVMPGLSEGQLQGREGQLQGGAPLMNSLRSLLDELHARASLTWPSRVTSPAPAVRQSALVGDKEALAKVQPSHALGPREQVAARALLSDRRSEETDVEPEPVDVEVLLLLPHNEAFQLRQLFAVKPMLARGSEASWLRVDQAILARHGIEAASVVALRPGSALFVRDASLVPSMMAKSRVMQTREAAHAWLLRHADLAAAYAVRAALGKVDREGGASLLAYLFHHDRGEIVDAALTRLNAEALRPLLERPYVSGLPYMLASLTACPVALLTKLPLERSEVALVVSALEPSGVGESALLEALRSDVEAHLLGDLGRAWLEAWRTQPAPAWWLFRATELGDGRMPRALARTHRALFAKKDKRALLLLDALAQRPTEVALFELGRVADGDQAAPRARARALLQPHAQLAQESVDHLIDHMMPSLDLDARGERPIEGAEGWSLVVTRTLAVVARDPSGGLLTTLPSSKAMAIQKSAVTELEAELRALTARAKKRLEQAMCDARPLDAMWMTKLIAHPALFRLAEALVWQDAEGAFFRIAEDRTAATLEDETRPLPTEPVWVAHPAHMNDQERAAWRALLVSYELVPSFAQLDRRVHALSDAQRTATTLASRFFATRVYTLLDRGFRLDWGGDELKKVLPSGDTLCIALDPRFDLRVSAREQGELHAITTLHQGAAALPLGALDPAIASELLDLMPPLPTR